MRAARRGWCSAATAATRTTASTPRDRKSTRLNSSHTEIYTLSLHDALPILPFEVAVSVKLDDEGGAAGLVFCSDGGDKNYGFYPTRSEEHTSELQSHRDLHSFPTRRSSDLAL